MKGAIKSFFGVTKEQHDILVIEALDFLEKHLDYKKYSDPWKFFDKKLFETDPVLAGENVKQIASRHKVYLTARDYLWFLKLHLDDIPEDKMYILLEFLMEDL